MKEKLSLIIIFFTFFIGNSQEREIEKIYSDCYFNSMPSNGKEVKRIYKTYEKQLISKGILADNSGESYYTLFRKVMSEKFIDNKTNYSLIDSINKLEYSDLIHYNIKCTEKIKSSKKYINSNTFLLEKRIDSIKDNFDAEKAAEIYIKTLNEKDFQIEFYKLRALLVLEMNKSLLELGIGKPKYSKERIENSLNIYFSEENLTSLNGKKTSKTEMENIVIEYLSRNKEKSLISVKSSRQAIYGEYLKLKENLELIFLKFKNKISIKRFNKKFDSLTKNEREEIEKEYSFEIYDKEPE
ncbi:hypothetical protein [Polaribacter marinaquae]|uniref:Uncharacterized protein n=1 Tax=Polaribacter marinaquae TaxID=1642819 RepID=A0ABZ2TPW1_9FLAO